MVSLVKSLKVTVALLVLATLVVVSWGASAMADFSTFAQETACLQQNSASTALPAEEESTSAQVNLELLEDAIIKGGAHILVAEPSKLRWSPQPIGRIIDRPQAIHRPPWV